MSKEEKEKDDDKKSEKPTGFEKFLRKTRKGAPK